MATKQGFSEIDANSHEAITRFFTRGGRWEPSYLDMPFREMLKAESDGEDEPAGEYEFKQRVIGVKVFFAFLKAKGATPMDFFRQLTAVARAMHIAPFHEMTMHEIAMMEGQSPAAHSWRCKILSGEIELAGMKGSRLPGQKTKAASDSYKECRKGNQNRKGGNKVNGKLNMENGRGARARQKSFLKKLNVPRKSKPKTPTEL